MVETNPKPSPTWRQSNFCNIFADVRSRCYSRCGCQRYTTQWRVVCKRRLQSLIKRGVCLPLKTLKPPPTSSPISKHPAHRTVVFSQSTPVSVIVKRTFAENRDKPFLRYQSSESCRCLHSQYRVMNRLSTGLLFF